MEQSPQVELSSEQKALLKKRRLVVLIRFLGFLPLLLGCSSALSVKTFIANYCDAPTPLVSSVLFQASLITLACGLVLAGIWLIRKRLRQWGIVLLIPLAAYAVILLFMYWIVLTLPYNGFAQTIAFIFVFLIEGYHICVPFH